MYRKNTILIIFFIISLQLASADTNPSTWPCCRPTEEPSEKESSDLIAPEISIRSTSVKPSPKEK